MYTDGYGVKQDNSEAAKWYKLAAEQGNGEPLLELARSYYYGENYSKVIKCYKIAAERGNVKAQLRLGEIYDRGNPIKKPINSCIPFDRYKSNYDISVINCSEAIKWYMLAAEQGEPEAQFNLGKMYEKGRGVKQDFSEAVKWYRLAAEQGYRGAQRNLGEMYEKGCGVEQSYSEAIKWYKLAYATDKLGSKYHFLLY